MADPFEDTICPACGCVDCTCDLDDEELLYEEDDQWW